MYVTMITLIALLSIATLYFWQGANIYAWNRAQDRDTQAPHDEWEYEVIDGPGWFLITSEVGRDRTV